MGEQAVKEMAAHLAAKDRVIASLRERLKRAEGDRDRLKESLESEHRSLVDREKSLKRAEGENERCLEEIRRLKIDVKARDDVIGLSPNGDRHAHLVSAIEELKTDNRALTSRLSRARGLLGRLTSGIDCDPVLNICDHAVNLNKTTCPHADAKAFLAEGEGKPDE